MTFENSIFAKQLNFKKISLSFGNFYLLDNFTIAEINEGIHLDWNKIEELINHLVLYYGEDIRIGYLTNRVNSYSIEPQSWIKFEKEYGFIVASAIVVYNDFAFINATLEKQFAKSSIKRCNSLDQAISWMQNLKEFK